MTSQLYGKFLENKKIIALILFAIVFLLKLPLIHTPHHWDSLNIVGGAWAIYNNNPSDYFGGLGSGHPPLFFIILTIAWKFFGYSLLLTNLIVIIFSFLGVYYTFLLGTQLKDERVGFIACLFLFFDPLYFAQSGIANLDLPLASFTAMALYFALREKTFLCILSSICLVLTKETGLFVVLSILFYIIGIGYQGNKVTLLKKIGIYSIPLLVFLGWLFFYKWKTGRFVYTQRDFVFQLGILKLHLYNIARMLFVENYHFLLTGFMMIFPLSMKSPQLFKRKVFFFPILGLSILSILSLFLKIQWFYLFIALFSLIAIKLMTQKKSFLLFSLFIICAWFAFANLATVGLFLPRYLIIVYPVFYIVGSYCIVMLLGNRNRILFILGVIFICLLMGSWDKERTIYSTGSGAQLEANLEYLDVIKTHKLAAEYIEKNYLHSSVLTTWPQIFELSLPYLGYVSSPIKFVYFDKLKPMDRPKYDLIYYSDQSHEAMKMLLFLKTQRVNLLQTYYSKGKFTAIYELIKE